MTKVNLPGHAAGLQETWSSLLPAQGAPPFEGAGLLQVRVRTLNPPPHDREQALYAPKAPQFPWTKFNCILT